MNRARALAAGIALLLPAATSAQGAGALPPRFPIPMNPSMGGSPCVWQPRRKKVVDHEYPKATIPSADEVIGTWVAIGAIGKAYTWATCRGFTRGPVYEFILVISRDAMLMDIVGMPLVNLPFTFTTGKELSVPVKDRSGNTSDYRCRLRARFNALLCVEKDQIRSLEFIKKDVKLEQHAGGYPGSSTLETFFGRP